MARLPAARIARVEPPATLAAGERAYQLAQQGRDIIDLSQSSPYHTTPSHIIEAGVQALRGGLTNISSSRGLPELRQAMANKLAAHNDLDVDPEGDILVTPGSKKGLFDAINSYIGAGDEVLLVEPTWVSYRQQVELSEGIPVSVPLSEEEEYSLSYQRLKDYVTPRSKMVVINNPNNPTGRVYTRGELEGLARLAEEHDLLVLCDETYEYFLYDGHEHLTFAALPGMGKRTLTSYTFTKSYSMSGWRLGCIVAPDSLLDPLLKVHEHTSSFVAPFVQMAGLEALEGPHSLIPPTVHGVGIGPQAAGDLRPRQARLLLEPLQPLREVVGEDVDYSAVAGVLSRHGAGPTSAKPETLLSSARVSIPVACPP